MEPDNPLTGIDLVWNTLEGWKNSLLELAPNIVLAILLFVVIIYAGRGIRNLILKVTTSHQRSHNVGIVVGRLGYGITVIIGFFIALMIVIPSINAGQVVSALGISSIAIGFAFKDILQNFLAGILILLTQPFRIGDQIIVKEFEGTVTEIQTRATIIRTYDNRQVVIPNSDLFTQSVTVNTAFERRRTEYDFGIGYEDDVAQAKQIMLDVLRHTEGILHDPEPDVLTVELDDSSVNIRARWWTGPTIGEVLNVQDRVISQIKRRFDAAGITIPFPITTVQIGDGNRNRSGS